MVPSSSSKTFQTKTIIFIFLFIVALVVCRFLWMNIFSNQHPISVTDGQVDLSDWDSSKNDIFVLDGEWGFYPHQFVSTVTSSHNETIQVPNNWASTLHSDTSFGYGTYHLRMKVHPEQQERYGLKIPSVRSASSVYVNGELLGESGKVDISSASNIAKNLPYTVYFHPDKNGIIDIVIQASNFDDIRGGGIARSILFGSEKELTKYNQFTQNLQYFTITILFVHGLYAFFLYILGNRDKRLLYFTLTTYFIMLTNSISYSDKVFHQFFDIPYDWDFRLSNITLLLVFYCLLKTTDYQALRVWKKVHPVYEVLTFGTIFVMVWVDTTTLIRYLFPAIGILIMVAAVVSLYAFFRSIARDFRQHLLLFFATIALLHHFTWTMLWREIAISIIYYPFDLLIAIGCVALHWLQLYRSKTKKYEQLAAHYQEEALHQERFLATTSHEFKNPLHSMINLTESTLHKYRKVLDNRDIHHLETVIAVGNRLSFLLNDLLDAQSIREGRPQISQKPIYAQAVVTGVIDLLQINAKAKNVSLINQVPADFPAVAADENRLSQIFFNLIHNAIKFNEKDDVTIYTQRSKDMATFFIQDNGQGMDKRTIDQLFQPYQRNTADIEGGLGLGLYITKQLVELHDGTISVVSKEKEGSIFQFSIPLANTSVQASPNKEEAPVPVEPIPLFDLVEPSINHGAYPDEPRLTKTPQVMVVDDDPVNLQVIESIFNDENVSITTTTSAASALKLLKQPSWDLIITDIMMPNMSGYELTKKIRQQFDTSALPVLILTARSQMTDIKHGFHVGANDYIVKPVDATELKVRVFSLLTLKLQIDEKLELESAWLRAQIKPHFIFNTLNAILSLSDIDKEKMKRLLEEFSEFLKYKFQFHDLHALVPIEKELHHVRSYIYVETVRFGDRIHIAWDVNYDESFLIPFLSIQPLVENAINHGIMRKMDGGTVTIHINEREEDILIQVEDDGVGLSPEKLADITNFQHPDKRMGIGIYNINQRLQQYFNTPLHISSEVNKGTQMSFTIPKQRSATRKIKE